MKRLIINADDLGLTAGVNRAIFSLAGAGALSSATLMAAASTSEAAAVEAREYSRLGIGCHITLVDGVPLLPASEVPSLIVPRSTSFRQSLASFVLDLVRGRVRESEIEAEAIAQIRRLQRMRIPVTHLDTHKHTHMFPRVLRPLLRAALQCGVRAIRNPFEPEWSVAATSGAPLFRRAQVNLLRTRRAYFTRATAQSGLVTTGGAVGVLATGSLDATTLHSLLQAMPEGTWELVCHPGYNDSDLRSANTRLLESREVERRAILEVVPTLTATEGLSLINFGDLAAQQDHGPA
ncbi:MAG TPA: ChbG/HpnK family deacetylase [Acidisarcina sp.]